MDEGGKAVYLTGSHTWNNFLDGGWETIGFHNPTTFNYEAYLDWMEERGQNFIRLWTPENARDFDPSGSGGYVAVGSPVSPTLYVRDSSTCTTNCNGYDGLRKFNLSELNDAYFGQLADRIAAAKEKNIYVSIMLFNGWGVGRYDYFSVSGSSSQEWWRGHPYNAQNNINTINGDPNTLGNGSATRAYDPNNPTAINALQDAYVLRVIEEVKYFDNVLFEISNEDYAGTSPTQWQDHIIQLIHDTEAEIEGSNNSPTPTYRHPVGMTIQYNGTNTTLLSSDADWVSFGHNDNVDYEVDPVEALGDKVVILDTDHLQNNLGNYDRYPLSDPVLPDKRATREWVWKSFTMGYNPIYMDQMYEGDDTSFGGAQLLEDYHGDNHGPIVDSPHRGEVRDAMGDTRCYAERMNLIDMTPHPELSSTGYLLAKVGEEYLVYQPLSEECECEACDDSRPAYFTVTLPANTYNIERFDPETGDVTNEGPSDFLTEDDYGFTAPAGFCKDAVLYLTIYERDHLESRPRS